jgi:GTP-binding protein
MKPIVAIVGRPNVGKSTLFNRITGTRNALVNNLPGVTRDRHYGEASWNDLEFTLVDTGGFSDGDELAEAIQFQVHQAIEDADVILLVLDGKEGISPYDRDLIDILRGTPKPVFYVVNKIDGPEQEVHLYEFYQLGIDPLYPVSAEHRYGLMDFLDDLVRRLEQLSEIGSEKEQPETVALAVVGRPNVGKSSLINRILGEERLLVSDTPGTTRDAVDSIYRRNGKTYLLIDTAGIRRKGKVSRPLEKFSIIKALRSLDRCDIALIVLDAVEGITDQDLTIARYAHERGCGCIFLMNKWDQLQDDSTAVKRYTRQLREQAKFLQFAPILSISALTGLRISKIFRLVDELHRQYTRRIGTGQLNRILQSVVERNSPALLRGKAVRLYYMTQVSAKPPTLVCFTNHPEAIHFSYQRYLLNQIREQTGLDKTPIRIVFRQRESQRRKGGKKKVEVGKGNKVMRTED